MGLAASQARLLTLTRRKSDCEFRISKNSTEKMSLVREQSKLANDYYSMLNSKKLSYVRNGEYQNLDYTYLMGKPSGKTYLDSNAYTKKSNYMMVLTDSSGLVVINSEYANKFKLAGLETDKSGKGRPFGQSDIKNVLYYVTGISPEYIEKYLDGQTEMMITNSKTTVNAYSGETTGTKTTETNIAEGVYATLDYFYPIVLAAATNGWTTEYNHQIDQNNPAYDKEYVNNALLSGVFQLSLVDEEGCYKPDTSLAYFTTCGALIERTDSDERERVTAWYNAERSRLTEKENYLDMENTDLSTELESIKTSITSIESFIKDAVTSVFDWGSS